MYTLRRGLLLLLLGVALALMSSSFALAHPKLLSTEPAAGATLDASPPQVRIVFAEPLERAFSRVELYNAQRERAVPSIGGLSLTDPTALELALPPLAPGVYTVVWQTVGADGHKVQGNFAFTVQTDGATTATVAAATTAPSQPTPVAAADPVPTTGATAASEPLVTTATPAVLVFSSLLRAAMLLGAVGLLGGWVVYSLVVQPVLTCVVPEAVSLAARRWRRVSWAALLLLLGSTIAMLLVYTVDLAGSLDISSVLLVLRQSSYGGALGARLGLLVLLIGVLALWQGTSASVGWGAPGLGLFGGGLLLTWSLSGHAAAQAAPLWPVLADWFHLAATTLWVGGLLAFALVLLPVLRSQGREVQVRALAQAISQFSPLALLSVVVLTISGTYAALQHLNTWSDLWASSYGWALLLKLCCFGGLLLLGAYNLLLVRPRFEGWALRFADAALAIRWRKRFAWALRAELLLALVALSGAGWLTSSSPPNGQNHAAHNHAAAPVATQPPVAVPIVPNATQLPTATPVPSRPFDQTQTVADLRVRLEVVPASINQNTFTVEVRNAVDAPLTVQLVRLTCTMQAMDMGTNLVTLEPQGDGRYGATASPLSMVGDWQIQVLVRRVDAPDVVADFVVPVGE